jgi:nicotinic acid mononucleotide adenylyltransferase
VVCDRIDRVELDVSSSGIRQALAAGEVPRGVPAAVLQYALEHRIYR